MEYAQRHAFSNPMYTIQDETGPDHAKYFQVEVLLNGKPLGCGKGRSKKIAEQMAACQAMHKLGLIPEFLKDSSNLHDDAPMNSEDE